MEGRFNIADFDLFELPTVPVYFIYSNPRSIENKLMAMIRSRYFV
ncbi:hypothetical protein [Rummeliibacillus sp. SL167]|jgi:hypothetical protein|nr:hypothetical protein [Rummeliibacillus sp. SL167]